MRAIHATGRCRKDLPAAAVRQRLLFAHLHHHHRHRLQDQEPRAGRVRADALPKPEPLLLMGTIGRSIWLVDCSVRRTDLPYPMLPPDHKLKTIPRWQRQEADQAADLGHGGPGALPHHHHLLLPGCAGHPPRLRRDGPPVRGGDWI
jgi:hypothetical protein